MLLSKLNVRDATCSLRSHWLARCARTCLLRDAKIYENLRKSTKIYENLRKSKKIVENLRKSMKIYENLFNGFSNIEESNGNESKGGAAAEGRRPSFSLTTHYFLRYLKTH